MDPERAETHLRRLAEAELRRVTALPADSAAGQWHAPGLMLAGQALSAAGAVDAGTVKQIQADFAIATAARQLTLLNADSPPGALPPAVRERLEKVSQAHFARASASAFPVSGGPGTGDGASPRSRWRIVPSGQVIPSDGRHGELLLLAYVQTAAGARFTMAVGRLGPAAGRGPGPETDIPPQRHRFNAVDDRGASYQLGFRGMHEEAVFELRPDPPQQIRWLDLSTAPGEPAVRIDLDPDDGQVPAPDVTVTPQASSPGELLLDIIAARILTVAASFPQDTPEQLAAAKPELLSHPASALGEIITALQAAGALAPGSPLPGQFAGLCARLGISGHGITAAPASDLPERWESMLTRYHRRAPDRAPAPGSWAAPVAELPELDGARLAILGLHHGESGTTLHMLASGVTTEDDWVYSRVVRPLPVLWIRDSDGRWHTTRTRGVMPPGGSGEVVLWLDIVPPLDRGADWIEVAAAGRSAEARAWLPLAWKRIAQEI